MQKGEAMSSENSCENNLKIEKVENNEITYWYVLFTKTGYEKSVLKEIEKCFVGGGLLPFIPLLEIFHRYANKRIEKEIKPLFPGYVFIESELDSKYFYILINQFIRTHRAILKILKYGESDEMAIREEERQTFLNICNNEKCIETSVGFLEGDKIIVSEGPLKGKESIIKRINRYRREAIIEIEILGRTIPVKVGIDIIEKLP
jgi:transcriptional antiterminator NusG